MYVKMVKEGSPIFCINCKVDNIPFQNLSDLDFDAAINGIDINIEILSEISITSTTLKSFFSEVNESVPFGPSDCHDDENDSVLINCKYTDICSFKYKKDKKKFSLFHSNIASLQKHKDELETILSSLDYKFDIIGLTESKLIKNVKPKFDIKIEGYNCYHTDTESEKGGSMVYVSDSLDSKERKDLQLIMYKPGVLESSFVEIINPHTKNILICCIYRHPSMDLKEFNEDFLNPLLTKLDKEKKYISLETLTLTSSKWMMISTHQISLMS